MQQSRVTVIFPAITFALVGAFLSGVLLVQHSQAERGDCGSAGCADVLSSRWATFPPAAPREVDPTGVPVALLGLLYFAMLGLWLIVVGRPSWSQRLWHSLPMGLASVGVLVTVALIVGMSLLGAWCPLCLAVHAMNLALVPYIFLSRPERGPNDADEPVNLRPVLMGAAVAVLGGAAVWFGWDSYQQRLRRDQLTAALARASAGNAQSPVSAASAFANTKAPPAITAPNEAWVLESTGADPDSVVVFTDLHCPACRSFEHWLFDVLAPQFQNHVRVAIKHYPLCAQCNPGTADIHPWACEAAYLAEAARDQGGSMAFLKALRAITPRRTQPWTDEDAIALALDLGLSPQKFVEAWQSDAVRNRVSKDIAEARAQGVNQTPTVFVNGRKLDPQVRDLPEFWEQLASRPRSTGRSNADVAAVSNALPHQSAKPVNTAAPADASAAPLRDRRTRAAEFMLSMHDANKDGVLQRNEWTKLYSDGTKIDTNHDQLITQDEIFAGIRDIQGGPESAPSPTPSPTAVTPGKTPPKPVAETPRISTVYEGDELDVSGPTLAGSTFNLRDHRGKPVLLAFWTSWCTHCVDETPELIRLYRKYHDLGLEIVGVNGDISTAAAQEFVERNQLPWPQIHFAEGTDRGQLNPIARRYNVRGYPALFLVNQEGAVSGVHLRGANLEMAIAESLGAQPTPADVAEQDRAELDATLFRPTSPPREKAFDVQLGDRLKISGPTIDGGVFDVEQHRGKPVLVAFWASWCPHCKEELPAIREVYERYQSQGLVVVGISADRKADDLNKYLGQNPLPWPTIYFDQEGLRGFNSPLTFWHGIRSIPALYLLDGEGKVAAIKPRGNGIEREVAKVLGVTPSAAALAATPAQNPAAAIVNALIPGRTQNNATTPAAPSKPNPISALDNVAPQVLAQAIVKRYDANADGILQQAEFSQMPGDFARYDANQDEKLTTEELSLGIAVVQQMKTALTAPRAPKAKTPRTNTPGNGSAPTR